MCYSTVSNKREGSNKPGGLQILEESKIKLGCIDAKPWIHCIRLIAFVIGTSRKLRNVRIETVISAKMLIFKQFFL